MTRRRPRNVVRLALAIHNLDSEHKMDLETTLSVGGVDDTLTFIFISMVEGFWGCF